MMLSRKISRWLDRRSLQFPEDWEVTWTNEGFVFKCRKVEDETPSFAVRWADVDAVYAFQVDLLTIDGVVLEFVCRDETYEVMQDTRGWKQFAPSLSEHLPGISEFHTWYRLVTRTTFNENREHIYSRKREAQQVGAPDGDIAPNWIRASGATPDGPLRSAIK